MVAITHPGSLGSLSIARPRRPSHPTAAVYRRRRLFIVGVVALVIALGSFLADSVSVPATPSTGRPVARVSVVVQPGDTVWSLAADVAPGEDPRPIVDAIVDANAGADLVVGQRLDITVP